MLKTETIHSIAKALKMEPQDLEAKIKSEGEEDITLPELKVFTPEEFETRIKNETTSSYNDGKEAGVEMLVKNKKKELGYDFEGKDIDSLLNYHTEKLKAEAGKPNERVAELEKDLEKLNQTHKQALEATQKEAETFKSQLELANTNQEILSFMPKETTIPNEDILTLWHANYETQKTEDGRRVVKNKRTGEVLKNETTRAEIPLKDVFNEFIAERKYVKGTAGRGGDNEFGKGGSQVKSISAFQDQWQKKTGKELNSPEFDKDYAAWRAENKEVTA